MTDNAKVIQESFDLHDLEKKQRIVRKELGNALRACGLRLTEANVKTLQARCDAENGGSVDRAAFDKYVDAAKTMQKQEADIRAAFATFEDGSCGAGFVDTHTLITALTQYGDKLTIQQVDSFLADLGVDGGNKMGAVGVDEFCEHISKATMQ